MPVGDPRVSPRRNRPALSSRPHSALKNKLNPSLGTTDGSAHPRDGLEMTAEALALALPLRSVRCFESALISERPWLWPQNPLPRPVPRP